MPKNAASEADGKALHPPPLLAEMGATNRVSSKDSGELLAPGIIYLTTLTRNVQARRAVVVVLVLVIFVLPAGCRAGSGRRSEEKRICGYGGKERGDGDEIVIMLFEINKAGKHRTPPSSFLSGGVRV